MNIIKKNKVSINENNNKIIKILANIKIWNLFKFKILIQFQLTDIISESNYWTSNAKLNFIELR